MNSSIQRTPPRSETAATISDSGWLGTAENANSPFGSLSVVRSHGKLNAMLPQSMNTTTKLANIPTINSVIFRLLDMDFYSTVKK